uniref:Uncharacterized protein n=1 Tax=Amphimedon queenslandica TaxID=400682 RepID=A0A1X7V5L2_AMPQE
MPSCQQASSSKTQVTTTTDVTAQGVIEVRVSPGYEAEFDKMGDMLGTLIHNIVPLIKAAIPSVNDLKTYIRRCRPRLENRLEKAKMLDAVMRVIEDECSITNVALLETIVNKYSIQDAGDMILAYQTHLDEFCENKLTMFCNRQLKRLSSSLLTCETIKFVLEWNPKFEKEDSKMIENAIQIEIDHLQSSLQSKIGVEEILIKREKEIEQLQEKISLLNIQHTSIPVKPSEFRHKMQENQQQIEPTPSESLIDDTEIELATLCLSFSSSNVS